MFNLTEERSYPFPYNNSVLLPLLLMSVAVQKHAPKTKRHFRSQYDYIVIGSGAAGSVVASRLSEIPFVDVLVLEAGKSPPLMTDVPDFYPIFTDLDWNFQTVPQEHAAAGHYERRATIHAGKCIGGSSSINSMMYVRGNAEDYNDWERQGNTGWGYKDVLPYFKKSEHNSAFPADVGYHGNNGVLNVQKIPYHPWMQYAVLEAGKQLGYPNIDYNGHSQKGVYATSVNLRNGQRCGVAKAFLVPAENRPNLDIIERAVVTKIIMRGRRAVGVEVEYKGRTHTVRARREVILSAGAINSAKLLMLSGIGPVDHLQSLGINVVANLPVGNNFHIHGGSILNYQADFPSPSWAEKRNDSNHILEYIYARKGVLGNNFINLAFLNNGKYSPDDRVDHQLMFIDDANSMSSVRRGNIPTLDEYLEQFRNTTLISCIIFNAKPKSRGTIRLNSKDPHDPPLVDPKFHSEPDDLKAVVEGMKHCKEIFESEPFQRVKAKALKPAYPGCQEFENDDNEFFTCMAQTFNRNSYHPVGTAKMGSNKDSTAVVNSELRVRGIRGLRVVDGSVIPTIPSGNTHIPIVMIAEKASDMIKRTLH